MKRSSVFARGSVELVVVIVGVVLGLAVDRWVSGSDDRARAELWAEQLSEDLLQDSIVLETLLSDYSRFSEFGVDALRLMDDDEGSVGDPTEFILNLERIAWWIPFDPARDTWDEIMASGQLSVFSDDVRSELTRYYGRLDYIAVVQSRWGPIFGRYWTLEQPVIPPLLRIGVMDGQFGMDAQRPVSQAEATTVLEAFRRDPALQGALGTAVQTYRYGALILRSVLPSITTAREALGAR